MTRDEITRMARETGVYTYPEWMHGVPMVTLERFFHLAYAAGAAAEREACAKVAETYVAASSMKDAPHIATIFKDCAAAIRARGQQ